MCKLSIDELRISNYRKFLEENFKLNPRMNVFAGKNGSGKTTVLEAACVSLGAYLAAYKKYVPSRFVFNISKSDAHLKPLVSESDGVMTTGGIPQFPCKIECSAIWENGESLISFQRILEKAEGRTKFDEPNPMQPVVVSWESAIEKAIHEDKCIIFPLVLYLSSARLWNESNSSSRTDGVYGRTDAYNRCLDKKHGVEFAFEYIHRLQSVDDEIATDARVILSTRYSKDLVALKTKEGTVVPFTTLSDGYRNVIKIVLDIAARMCMLNPYLKGNALKETPGVVVIDEIDLSLHPTWQRRIIGILKDLFPQIQFICATHSPFIIQSLEDGELHSLDSDLLEEEYSGESIEDIAEDIMGVEMPQYSEKKKRMYEAAEDYFKALDDCRSAEELDELRKMMEELEAEYSDNPAYLALIRQQNAAKEIEIKRNETD